MLEENIIISQREGIRSLLPSLWLILNPVFDLEEEYESNPWCAYADGKLLLSSVIVLKVKNQNKMRSLSTIKQLMERSGIVGESTDSVNTFSIFLWDRSVELFAHRDVPYLFINLYVYLDIIVESFDAQIVSLSYFDFILKQGLISMDKGIIKVDMEKKEEKDTPSLYGGLYNKD